MRVSDNFFGLGLLYNVWLFDSSFIDINELDECIRIKIGFQCFHLFSSGKNCVSQVFHHF